MHTAADGFGCNELLVTVMSSLIMAAKVLEFSFEIRALPEMKIQSH